MGGSRGKVAHSELAALLSPLGAAEVKRAGGRALRPLPEADKARGSGGLLLGRGGVSDDSCGGGPGAGAVGRGRAAAITCRAATSEHPRDGQPCGRRERR